MERFVPLEKRSKKQQREYNAKRRTTWGGLNPVTRKQETPKAYNRRKARKWREDLPWDRAFSALNQGEKSFAGDLEGLSGKRCKKRFK